MPSSAWKKKTKDNQINFKDTDKVVKGYQEQGVAVLATVWPFANWDQKNRSNASDCKVDDTDQFLPFYGYKGGGHYLPEYRCNPNDWQAYEIWLKALIERYDGDGYNDMPGLKYPIKYWEVMN